MDGTFLNFSNETIVVNLFGGPSSGKTSVAAAVFSELKRQHISVELVAEFARETILDGSSKLLNFQPLITTTQSYKIIRLLGKVDYIITDSPILLGVAYADLWCTAEWKTWVFDTYNKMQNLNYYLIRSRFISNDPGRVHSEEESIAMDTLIKSILEDVSVKYLDLASATKLITQDILYIQEHKK